MGAKGGLPPYTFTRLSGLGNGEAAGYNTGGFPGLATVQIQDGLGSIQVVNANIVNPVKLMPTSFALEINKNFNLTISDGIAPYLVEIESGNGSVSSNVFSSGINSGTSVIKVTDKMNQIARSNELNVCDYHD